MACRDQQAVAARTKLLVGVGLFELFGDDVVRFHLRRKGSNSNGGGAEHHVEAFRASLIVAVHLLDLASVRNTDDVAHT